ncbi:inter-alpha-trypsin inhibitor-like isoform X1 [Amblyraja radiata]|uniref:inter-alpha-trypsin inhibitor-like isoform X1 n=1 Tax=Amblyraja radiata TaxID=386614 RepID=UPI001402423C|nr:inter-alpha-trypsin inhibitor-like isoform X1 [Amblyraja radiata]
MWCALLLLCAVQLLGTGTAVPTKANADFQFLEDLNVNQARTRRTVEDTEGSGFGAIQANEESCQLAPDSGACFQSLRMFFYNQSSMTCETFNYGGCLGNKNRFVTEQQCLQTCRTVAACRLPVEIGSCRMSIKLWAFDSVNGKCITFKYGGCEGNGNRFYTEKECMEYCDPIPEGEEELLTVQ